MAHSVFFAILCTLAVLAPLVLATDSASEDSGADTKPKHHCGRHGHHHRHRHPNHRHHPHSHPHPHHHHHHHRHGPKDEQPNTNVTSTGLDQVTEAAIVNVVPGGNHANVPIDVNNGQGVTNNIPVDVGSNAVSTNDGARTKDVKNRDHHHVVHDNTHEGDLDHIDSNELSHEQEYGREHQDILLTQ